MARGIAAIGNLARRAFGGGGARANATGDTGRALSFGTKKDGEAAALAKQTALWLTRFNPLHGLNEVEAQLIYDAARNGNTSRLHWLYSNLEKTDPTLLTCVERRAAALVGLDWKVVARPTAGNEALADEQAKAAEEALAKIDNLPAAIEHLGLAFFRGFAHVAPVWDADGLCRHIDLPESWYFVRDPFSREWYWNPSADYGEPGGEKMTPIPDGLTVCVEHPRAIDYPATSIFLRHTLAEMSWGQFLERFGIPPAILTMPDGMTDKEVTRFREAAQAFTEGLCGTLPFGSQAHFATEARGQNPFVDFIRHQEEQIVLLATGGTLTSLAQSGSGTLAGNAQFDVWREIVRRDGDVIGNALDKGLCDPIVRRLFPGSPVLCRFELGRDAALTPAEALDLAAKAKAGGYVIDRDALADAVGMPLERDTSGVGVGGPGLYNREVPADSVHGGGEGNPPPPDGGVAENKAADGVPHGPGEDGGGDSGASSSPDKATPDARKSFKADMEEAGRLIAALLSAPDEDLAEEARKAVEALPDTLPQKPKFAADLEEAIALGYAAGLEEVAGKEDKK